MVVGFINPPLECSELLADFAGCFSCLPSFGTFSLWGSQVATSGHPGEGVTQHTELAVDFNTSNFRELSFSFYSIWMPR